MEASAGANIQQEREDEPEVDEPMSNHKHMPPNEGSKCKDGVESPRTEGKLSPMGQQSFNASITFTVLETSEGCETMKEQKQDNRSRKDEQEQNNVNEPIEMELERRDEEVARWYNERNGCPWWAARVVMQYFGIILHEDEPCRWSIDDYDGGVTWMEMKMEPETQYRDDGQTTTTQHKEFRSKLMQLDMEADEVLDMEIGINERNGKWHGTRSRLQEVCEEA